MVIFIYYSHTYLFIIFVIIIKYTPWMSHPFRLFTYIDPPEMGITTSHERSLVEFNKTQGFKINFINNLSLSYFHSSA